MPKMISKECYKTLSSIAGLLPALGAYFTCMSILLFAYVPSGSMLPTFQLGDIAISYKLIAPESIEREDIVTFSPATEANADMGLDPQAIFVKRVVGLPGDTIEISGGVLYVNGEAQVRDYTAEEKTGDFAKVTVPEDSFFVMGDNRNYSEDSRFIGFIPFENLCGKVVFHTRHFLLPVLGTIL